MNVGDAGAGADSAADPHTRRLRRASRASFAVALTLPALATVAGWISEAEGALIVGTLLLPLLFGAMLANLLGWYRTVADKARIYLAVGSVFAVWSGAEVLVAAAAPDSPASVTAERGTGTGGGGGVHPPRAASRA